MEKRLKQIRSIANLNQDTFGKRLNLSRSHVASLESGARVLTDRIIRDVCREFNISEDWLRTGEGEMFAELSRNEVITAWASRITRTDYDNKFVPEFVEMLANLDERDWETVEKMTKFLYAKQQKRG